MLNTGLYGLKWLKSNIVCFDIGNKDVLQDFSLGDLPRLQALCGLRLFSAVSELPANLEPEGNGNTRLYVFMDSASPRHHLVP